MSGSPLPERYAVELPRPEGRGSGTAWYVLERWSADDFGEIRGGPFLTRKDAKSAIKAWHRELHELYDAVEERAREEGTTVAW